MNPSNPIILTDADNGQPLDIDEDWIKMVRVLDRTRTEVTTSAGEKIEVRESQDRIRHLRRRAKEATL